jgi:HD superfamily phosphohydrolase
LRNNECIYKKENPSISKLYKIYYPEVPDFLDHFFDIGQIVRLMGIGQHCGTEYVKIPMFHYDFFYSRFNHSLGVALILWNYTKDKKQTVAGFLHDISSTVFAHVGDFLKKDYMNQEHTELNTEDIIKRSNNLMRILSKEGLTLQDVSDYKIYPLADNKSPRLSADRLECTLHYPLMRGEWDLEATRNIYNDITVLKNEDGLMN